MVLLTNDAMTDALVFRLATLADVASIVTLVNSGYRGDVSRQGWTTEADLLAGQRTDEEEVAALLHSRDSRIVLCERYDLLLGSLYLTTDDQCAWLGMFTVRPGLQGQGVGSAMLKTAEAMARKDLGAGYLCMEVITLRTELIAFYERRGYRRTGRFGPFPDDIRYGTPKVTALRLECLEKHLTEGA